MPWVLFAAMLNYAGEREQKRNKVEEGALKKLGTIPAWPRKSKR